MRNSKRAQRGTAWAEYFIAATAVFLAAIWLFDGGNLLGARAQYESGYFQDWMTQLKGTVPTTF